MKKIETSIKDHLKNKYWILSLIAHIVFIAQIYFFGLYYLIVTTLIGIVVFNLAYSLYAHRTVCHKHYELSSTTHKVLGFLFNTLNFGSPATFASVHIKHHKYLNTNKDPHDPNRLGKVNTCLKLWDEQYTPDIKFLAILLKNPIYRNQHNNNYKIALLAALFTPYLPVVAFWLANILLVSVHPKNDTVNLYWLKPLLWGEELHKTHHENPKLQNHNITDTIKDYDFLFVLATYLNT